MRDKDHGGGSYKLVIFLCLCWYTTSALNNVVGKIILTDFPYPLTVTLCQLLSIVVYSGPLLHFLDVTPHLKSTFSWKYYMQFILPLGFAKFIGVCSSQVSIWKVPVSYAHTIKATMPLFTVLLTRILLKERQSLKVYCSLIPIMFGVATATITELSFDMTGLVAALFSTCIFALLQIFSKKVMIDTNIHHYQLLQLLGKLALVLFLPIWVLWDGFTLLYKPNLGPEVDLSRTMLLLALDGFLNWFQNVIAFRLLSLITPLSYSVASATKRISVILASLLVLRNPVTVANVFGMFVAILGVFAYNKIKHDDHLRRLKADSTPLRFVTTETPTSTLRYLPEVDETLLNRHFGPPLQQGPTVPLLSPTHTPRLGPPNSPSKPFASGRKPMIVVCN